MSISQCVRSDESTGKWTTRGALDRQPDFSPTAELTAELLDAKAAGSMELGIGMLDRAPQRTRAAPASSFDVDS